MLASFSLCAGIFKSFAEATFEKAIYIKKIPLLNHCSLLLKADIEIY
jgi:hypothetical protein